MITQYHCPTCKKRTDVLEEKPILSSMISRRLKCGHSEIVKKLSSSTNGHSSLDNLTSFTSISGKKLFPYQIRGIKFVEEANGRAGIFDEMGLGKTVQAIMAVREKQDRMLPCIVICKSIAKYNWMKHWLDWGELFSQVVTAINETWHEKFPIHIVSYELLRAADAENKSYQKIKERVKTVIIDETHLMKNDLAKRTKVVKKLAENAEYVIGLSGTPFKNQGGELFSILNTLRPDRFHNKERYLYNYWDVYRGGSGYHVGGLKYPERFKEDTKDFIIRRTMDEVLPDLPPIRRNHIFVELGQEVQKLYDEKMKEFLKFYDEEQSKMKSFEFAQGVLERLNLLRHICGIAKVDAGVEFAEDFLDSCERKLVIFVHHHRVAKLYEDKLNKVLQEKGYENCATLASKDKDRVESIVATFRDNPKQRVMIASTLAAGESINLQFASDCVLSERQWNPANEEQAGSGRFRRVGQKNVTNFNYLVAVGTIDEYFSELVEKKRAVFEQTMDGKTTQWNETSIIKELTNILIASRRKAWSL